MHFVIYKLLFVFVLQCKGTKKSRHVQIFWQKNDKKITFLSKIVIFIWLFEKKVVILCNF